MNLSHSEIATILHGLRMIQTEGRLEGCAAGMCDHFEGLEPLTNDDIDALCIRINCEASTQPTEQPAATVPGSADQLPPDPEDMNNDRAKWALSTVAHFGIITGECFESFQGEERQAILAQNVSDLVANLGHLGDREGFDLADVLQRARTYYTEETDDQGEQFTGIGL